MSEFNNESVSAIESTLAKVERALERLQSGRYRSCHMCGTEIDRAALEANPVLVTCKAHPELL